MTLRGRGKWISKDGDAYNPIRFNQKVTIHYNSDGYPCFGGGIPVHLYVATAWVDGWFEGAEVDHIDYNRKNYNSSNLRWVSHSENVSHSSDVGHYYNKEGIKNGRATFSEEDIDRIKKLFSLGMGTMEVIKEFSPASTYKERKKMWSKFNRIKTGETWNS